MKAEIPESTPTRHGFRKGWLYFRDSSRRLYRFRVTKEFTAEIRETGHGWRRIDEAERKSIEPSFWNGASRYFLDNAALLLFRSSFIERKTSQLCMPWVAPVSTRRAIRAAEQWERFKQSWPAPLLIAVRQVGSNVFRSLELFLQVPAAIDLAGTNPRLAEALSFHWEFPAVGRVDWNAVREIVQQRRRAILGWLGFPATDAAVNLVERMAECENARQLQDFMSVLTSPPYGPALSRTSGWIDSRVIELLITPQTRDWLDPQQIKAGPRWAYSSKWPPRHSSQQEAASFMDRVRFIKELLAIGAIDSAGARSLAARRRDHRSAMALLPLLRPHTLPNAPVPVTASVQRLDSLQTIIAEGDVMQHCVGEGQYRLMGAIRGFSAYYRVDFPVRATLALTQDFGLSDSWRVEPSVRWSIEELHGYQNSKISLRDALTIFAAFPTVTGLDQWIHNPDSAN